MFLLKGAIILNIGSKIVEKKLLIFVQLIIGYEWFSSGLSKVMMSHAESLAEILASLSKFASQNPYSFYKSFLLVYAIPSGELFSWLIPWGEFLAGATLIVSAGLLLLGFYHKLLRMVSLFALVGLIFMNINFWFAAGWLSPSTAGLNLVLGLIESVLCLAWLKVFGKR